MSIRWPARLLLLYVGAIIGASCSKLSGVLLDVLNLRTRDSRWKRLLWSRLTTDLSHFCHGCGKKKRPRPFLSKRRKHMPSCRTTKSAGFTISTENEGLEAYERGQDPGAAGFGGFGGGAQAVVVVGSFIFTTRGSRITEGSLPNCHWILVAAKLRTMPVFKTC